ncbi:hypothetical protein EK0264_15555 [Epidermidibacterium keratini]|uniref:Type IV toxin-antitoxin system AbiEi family antitoxin domain-containing protein n=1 Tax=Epidermidibacterium keratini TaxID=1891644 RepID=A0A7L4YSQ7_9ACTN|nr:hypothetical protein [Epidermidibacterium keratini]QHC01567.1 hypothetical protein EK0264_15555 [Epidermidibacterium keratini]
MRKRIVLPREFEAGSAADLGQLSAAGLHKHTASRREGELVTRVRRGLYVVGSQMTWHQQADAAIAACAPDAFLCATSALAAYGVPGFDTLPIHVLVNPDRRIAPPDWIRVHRKQGGDRKLNRGLSPPRVGFEDSVLDATDCLDAMGAIAVLTRVLQERRTTAHRLRAVLGQRARVRHRFLISAAISDAANGVHSALEHLYTTRVERAHKLPPLERQYIVPETGLAVDGALIAQRKLYEFDGIAFHDPDEDRERDNLHASFRYATSRFGWVDIAFRSCKVAQLVDPTSRCVRCR